MNFRMFLYMISAIVISGNAWIGEASDLPTAYDFTLPGLDKTGSVKLSEIIGKERFTILIFFNSRCGECMATFAGLRDFPEELRRIGISAQVIGINNDEKNPGILRDFLDKEKIKFPVLSDRSNIVSQAYKCRGYSFCSFILTRKGGIIDVHYDKRDDMMDYLIQKLIQYSGAE